MKKTEGGPFAIAGPQVRVAAHRSSVAPFGNLGVKVPLSPPPHPAPGLSLAAGPSLWRAQMLLAPPHLCSLGGPSGHCPWALGAVALELGWPNGAHTCGHGYALRGPRCPVGTLNSQSGH